MLSQPSETRQSEIFTRQLKIQTGLLTILSWVVQEGGTSGVPQGLPPGVASGEGFSP